MNLSFCTTLSERKKQDNINSSNSETLALSFGCPEFLHLKIHMRVLQVEWERGRKDRNCRAKLIFNYLNLK